VLDVDEVSPPVTTVVEPVAPDVVVSFDVAPVAPDVVVVVVGVVVSTVGVVSNVAGSTGVSVRGVVAVG
jgi:hypothetical protein